MSAGVLWGCVYVWRLLLMIYQLERHMLEPCRADVCICVYEPICAFLHLDWSAFMHVSSHVCIPCIHRPLCPLSYKIPRCEVGHRNKCTNSKQTWRTDRLTLCWRKEDRMWKLHEGTTIDLTTLQCVRVGEAAGEGKAGKKRRQGSETDCHIPAVFVICLSTWKLSVCAYVVIYSMSVPETSATCRIIYHSWEYH